MEDRLKFEMAMMRVRNRLKDSGQTVRNFRDLLDLAQQEMDQDQVRLEEQKQRIRGGQPTAGKVSD